MDLSLVPYNTNMASVMVEYKECMRNHAASMGRHAYDGCGEFMQAGAREALTCAACGCHRNFHRKEELESCVGLLRRLPVVEVGRKRRRTKFTQEQKEKMRAFAERVGWKVRRSDDGELGEFCEEVGVKRDVVKVWMHNNKTHFLRGFKCASEEVH